MIGIPELVVILTIVLFIACVIALVRFALNKTRGKYK